MRNLATIGTIVLVILGLPTSLALSDEPVVMTKDEVIATVSGKTEIWSKGAGYYAPDGTLEGVWKGDSVAGTWWVEDDGALCTDVDTWGQDCWTYYKQGEKVLLKSEGKLHEKKYKDGKQL